ncbi:MAG: GNAT family N-acetyltransferase [Chitinophagales bacterium]|nr:GNAT family N-acetyltransferase [Chitinophagales bacterium]
MDIQKKNYTIREGKATDVRSILTLVKELAEYEKAPEEVINTEEQMLKDGFGDNPIFSVLIAEDSTNKDVVGIALFYTAYSTWKGRMIYLDDIVVSRAHRRRGIGKILIEALFKIASQQGAKMMRWQVLDWNQPAIEFYKTYGVKFDEGWINCGIYEQQLSKFAD